MHIFGYLVGIVHYVFAPICIATSSIEKEMIMPMSSEQESLSVFIGMCIRAIALYLFVKYSLEQHRVHEALFEMKKSGGAHTNAQSSHVQNMYSFPKNGAFEYVACPHYFAEIMIYVSFCILALGATSEPLVMSVPIGEMLHLYHPYRKDDQGFQSNPFGFQSNHLGFQSNPMGFQSNPLIPRIDARIPLALPYSLLFMTLWVCSNLSVVADRQYQWYQEKFPEECKKRPHWKRIFPSLW
jgi:hypothetical protein